MHIATAPAASSAVPYRERLSPSLWTLLSAAIVGPMVGLVFVPLDATVALILGLVAGVALIALLILGSPVVSVRDGELRVGPAHIAVTELGEPIALTGEEARAARGTNLSATAWHMFRGSIDGVVVVPVLDVDDPVSEWVFSTRTPERIVAAIRRAQSN